MGGSSLLGGIMILINLPETLGEPLPETMEEALNLGNKKTKIPEAPTIRAEDEQRFPA